MTAAAGGDAAGGRSLYGYDLLLLGGGCPPPRRPISLLRSPWRPVYKEIGGCFPYMVVEGLYKTLQRATCGCIRTFEGIVKGYVRLFI